MASDRQMLDDLIEEIRVEFPSFKIVEKRTSRLMRALYYVSFMWLWNKRFMTTYHTTIGTTVYTPDVRGEMEERPWRYYVTLRHERQHMRDRQAFREDYGGVPFVGSLLWGWMYFFPQCNAVLALCAFWNPWMLLCLLFLAPWPAPGRVWIERRGYAETVRALRERGFVSPMQVEWVVQHFTGWDYYRMAWRAGPLRRYFSRLAKGDES